MSRHRLLRRRKLGHLVVGWDRPLDHFFCQVWSRAGRMSQSFTTRDLAELFVGIDIANGDTPDAIYKPLVKRLEDECNGVINANVLVDWTTTPPKETPL